MCRIVGIWNKSPSVDLEGSCSICRDTMIRGGPDDAGIFIDRSAGIAFGHRRLSIIDLTPTGQPAHVHQEDSVLPSPITARSTTIGRSGKSSQTKGYRIPWDLGYRGGAQRLRRPGGRPAWSASLACLPLRSGTHAIKCSSCSATAWGSSRCTSIRDRGIFAFASELKAIHACPASSCRSTEMPLGEFFHYGYIAGQRSIYLKVSKLEPGCWIRVNRGDSTSNTAGTGMPRNSPGANLPNGNEDALRTGSRRSSSMPSRNGSSRMYPWASSSRAASTRLW